jgi:hypothetical protein
MTAALGRLPVIQAGAWVWYGVHIRPGLPVQVAPGALQRCADRAQGGTGQVAVSEQAPRCVLHRGAKPG